MTELRQSSLDGLPGADLIVKGLSDLAANDFTIEALLVCIGEPRLARSGILLPTEWPVDHPEKKLYEALGERHGNAAHSQYNAIIRRLVSFERALEQRIARTLRSNPTLPTKL